MKIERTPPPRTSGFKRSNSYTGKQKHTDPETSKTEGETDREAPMDISPGSAASGEKHGNPRPSTSGVDTGKKYKWYQCNFQTTTKGYLSRHMNTRHPMIQHSPNPRYDPNRDSKHPSTNDTRGAISFSAKSHGDDFDFTQKPLKDYKISVRQ